MDEMDNQQKVEEKKYRIDMKKINKLDASEAKPLAVKTFLDKKAIIKAAQNLQSQLMMMEIRCSYGHGISLGKTRF